ncbi:MAG TPA: S-methyl-5-thioribose-1-phosphate isomerase, partial [Gemmatimonadaceae bacterium]|nr:S-methyl-5-thioribose-1-phosphate isomerase [Gemmatimonadaceae bacterium]
GVAGAMGLVASLARHAEADDETAFNGRVAEHAAAIRGTRPTAVNLPWAIDRMLARIGTGGGKREAVRGKRELHPAGGPPHVGVYGAPGADAGSDRRDTSLSTASHPNRALLRALRDEADAILEEDRAMCRRIGEHGLPLIADGARVLTHCNAGALATAGIGTALAPVYLAVAAGRRVEVFADETRPLLQGSRLTAWELSRAGIPVTVLADNMAASLMRAGRVDLCIVGADRIAANGDVANKVGTYALALAARHHGIPFYVAAPASTFDAATPTGDAIVIEQRSPDEIRRGFGAATAPEEADVYNPAFDVTPAELVTAIVSDRGVHRPPYEFGEGLGPGA